MNNEKTCQHCKKQFAPYQVNFAEETFTEDRFCSAQCAADNVYGVEKTSIEDFQGRVLDWPLKCFGAEISKDILERNDRFIEESLELSQSLNYTAERAHALVDYVFNRPKGEPFQECGGVMVTLAALCSATGLDMMFDGEVEYARINKPEIIEKIRNKQKSKPTGSALPIFQQTQSDLISKDKVIQELKQLKDFHHDEGNNMSSIAIGESIEKIKALTNFTPNE